jgi:hypothetical protein
VRSLNSMVRSAVLEKCTVGDDWPSVLRRVRESRQQIVRANEAYARDLRETISEIFGPDDARQDNVLQRWMLYHDVVLADLVFCAVNGARAWELERMIASSEAELKPFAERGTLVLASHFGRYTCLLLASGVRDRCQVAVVWRPTDSADRATSLLAARIREAGIELLEVPGFGVRKTIKRRLVQGHSVIVFADHADWDESRRNLECAFVLRSKVCLLKSTFELGDAAERVLVALPRDQADSRIRIDLRELCLSEDLPLQFACHLGEQVADAPWKWERLKHPSLLARR